MTTQALSAQPQKFDDVTVPLDNMRHEFVTGVVTFESAGTVMFLAIPAMGSSSNRNVCARRGGGKVSVKSQLQPSDDG